MEEEALFVGNDPADDPVISEIPVYLNNHAGDSLVVLQYPTRKAQDGGAETRQVLLKENAQLLETRLDAQVPPQFVDASSAGSQLSQKYSGVLNNSGAQYAVGTLQSDGFYITPVPKSGQMRPEFKAKNPVLNTAMLQTSRAAPEVANLRSVQMSVKSTSQEVPKHSVALGFWRQANKEDAVKYSMRDVAEHEVRELLAGSGPGETYSGK